MISICTVLIEQGHFPPASFAVRILYRNGTVTLTTAWMRPSVGKDAFHRVPNISSWKILLTRQNASLPRLREKLEPQRKLPRHEMRQIAAGGLFLLDTVLQLKLRVRGEAVTKG